MRGSEGDVRVMAGEGKGECGEGMRGWNEGRMNTESF